MLRVERMSEHFTKHHLDGFPFPAVIHHFTAPDRGDPHDHPWGFTSTIIKGWYVEEIFDLNGHSFQLKRYEHESFRIDAKHIHRIVDLSPGGCWTLVLPDPVAERKSGFYQFRDGRTFHRFWDGEFTEQEAAKNLFGSAGLQMRMDL